MERGLRLLLLLGALLGALGPAPLGAAPTPRRCPLAAPPPPPPTPPPLPPDCDPRDDVTTALTTPTGSDDSNGGGGGGDIALEGTGGGGGASNCSGDSRGHRGDVTGDATSTVTSDPATPGGDKVLVATSGDVPVQGTAQPGVTGGLGDTWGHLNDVTGDATTTVAFVTMSPGGDKVLVATQGDIAVEGTADPGVTGGPGDTLGRVPDVPGDATTTVTSDPASPGGDKVLVATSGDVAMEGTAQPGVTGGLGDTLGHLNDVPGDATTMVAFVTMSPGSDKVLVATSGDVPMEGTADPGVTGGPGDIMGGVTDVPEDATTAVTSVPASPGSDKVLVAPGGDVAMEGTAQPKATNCSGDTSGRVPDVPGDATTSVTSVPASPGGDKVLVATSGDVAMEGTAQPGVTGGPGDTWGHLNDVPGDATTTVTSVPASPGGDKVLVATSGDVPVEGTEDPGVTADPRDIMGGVTDVPRDATTAVTSDPASPGGDKLLVATQGDIAVEGTADPGVTGGPGDTLGGVPDVPGDATTTVTSDPASPGGDKVLVATSGDVPVEGTAQPGVTGGLGDTWGHLNDVPRDATTMVAFVTMSPGSDKLLVATSGDVAMEGTADPGVTADPRDTWGHLNDVTGDATTTVTSVPAASGGDKVLVATAGNVPMEGTADPGVTGGPGDIMGGVTDVPGDATIAVTSGPASPGSDKVLVAPGGDVAMEGTARPGATNCSGDTSGRVPDVPGDATTSVTSVPPSPGGDKVLVATAGNVPMEGTAQPGVTGGLGDTLGRVPDVPGDATTTVTSVPASSGGDKLLVATQGDTSVEGTADPGATADPRDTLGGGPDVPGDATTAVTSVPASPGGDKVLVAPGGDVALEGSGATNCSGDTRGHLGDVTAAATAPPAVTTPTGSDAVLLAGTARPAAARGDVTGNATAAPVTSHPAAATSSAPGAAILVAPGGDISVEGAGPRDDVTGCRPPLHGAPPPPAGAFPVTAAPPPHGAPGGSGSAPSPLPLLLLLLLPLPLLL